VSQLVKFCGLLLKSHPNSAAYNGLHKSSKLSSLVFKLLNAG